MRHRDRTAALEALVTDIATLKTQYPNAIDNARNWARRGFPARSPGFGDGSPAPGISDPVLAQIISGPTTGDSFLHDLAAADQRLKDATTAVAWLTRFVRRNQVVLPMEEPTDCIICGRYVARTTNDPLRRGRCNACDTYQRRHGHDKHIIETTP